MVPVLPPRETTPMPVFPAPRSLLRSLRTPRGHAPALVASLALGTALGGPVLSLARSRLGHPRPVPPPPAFDRPGAWTEELRVPETLQADALDGLVAIALTVAVLLLAGAALNVGTLLLARAAARRHEVAVRATLGATPGSLGRRALAEGALLGLIGGGAGVLLGAAGGALARDTWMGDAAMLARFRPLAGAATAAGGLTLLVLLSAALPMIAGARRNLYGALSTGGRATAGAGEAMLRKALSVLQFAGAATLLTGAALLLRASFPGTAAVHPGFDPRDTLTFRVELPAAAAPAERARMQRALLDGAAALPGVRAASAATPGAWLGLGPEDRLRTLCDACIMGNLFYPMGVGVARHHAVSPGYFAALGLRVLQGRELRAGDARAVVINRAFAVKLLPRADPVGQRVLLKSGWREDPYRVVGVVDDPRAMAPGAGGQPGPAVYLPSPAHPPRTLALAVRTVGAAEGRESAIRQALARAAPGASVLPGVAMQTVLDRERAPLRWFAALLAVLAAGATLASAGGLYGTMAFSVARRTREIGVRMAVGGTERQVLREVMGEGVRISLLGTLAGSIGALSLAQVLGDAFQGVDALDPVAYLGVAAALAIVTLAASYAPARRAARVDPNVALRAE
jgi:putative ABC transport system permease protein